MRNALSLSVLLSASMLVGCGGGSNSDRTGLDRDDAIVSEPRTTLASTTVIFNPVLGNLPVPSDLQFNAQEPADGTMFVSNDTTNPVFVGIDVLDGNSVVSPFDIPMSGSIDPDSLDAANFIATQAGVIPNPNQNVFLLALEFPGGDGLVQTSVELDDATLNESPTFVDAVAYQTAVAIAQATGDPSSLLALTQASVRAEAVSLDGGTNNVLRISPLIPLQAKTKYLVVVTDSVLDVNGESIGASEEYLAIRDGDTLDGLVALRTVINDSWEALAAGYFGFKQTVYDTVGASLSAPSQENIALSMTFTTGGTGDVLIGAAAPESFFENAKSIDLKQAAITNLLSGVYNLSADNSALTDPVDIQINTVINQLLTESVINGAPNPLFNEGIDGAITAGAGYETIAATGGAAPFILQSAAAQAAVSVQDPSLIASGTVQALAGAASEAGIAVFEGIPSSRDTLFYRQDALESINTDFGETLSTLYQGQITLPYFQSVPTEESGAALVTSSWIADPVLGAFIDAAAEAAQDDVDTEDEALPTPPSSAITYRYPFAQKQSDVTVPLIAVLPNEAVATKPEGGWPVVVIQHGIRADRSSALPMANALSRLCLTAPPLPCFATVAIDFPLHGVAPSGTSEESVTGSTVSGLYSVSGPDAVEANLPADAPNTPSDDLTERHYNYSDDAIAPTGVPRSMVYGESAFGSSGSLFINLTNFANVRDNLRQMTLDQMNLIASIAEMDVNADGTSDDLDESRIYYVGHSLGGIIGTTTAAVNNSDAVQASGQPFVNAASFVMPGGSIPRLLINSQVFGPSIAAGLANASAALATGTTGLETYLSVFQGVLDSVDPINFAASLSDINSNTGVLVFEAVGNGTAENPGDLVIPNAADSIWGEQYGPRDPATPPAPLAGTEPLIAQFGAVKSSAADDADADPAVLVTRLVEGTHSTPVNADPMVAFDEIVLESAEMFTLDGNVSGSIVSDPSVVEVAD